MTRHEIIIRASSCGATRQMAVLSRFFYSAPSAKCVLGVERGGDDDDENDGHLANDVAIRTKRIAPPPPATDRLRGIDDDDLREFGSVVRLRPRRRAAPVPCLRCQHSKRRRHKTAFRVPLPSGSALTRISTNFSSGNPPATDDHDHL